MEVKERSKGKRIVGVLLALILLAGIGFGAWYFFIRKKDDGGVKGTEVELASYAIKKVSERGSEIYKDYAKSSAEESSIQSNDGQQKLQSATISSSSDILTINELNLYFSVMQTCNIVPSAIDFVVNSKNSDVYTNKFELGKTYMAMELNEWETDNSKDGKKVYNYYYYKVEKVGSLVNCYLTLDRVGEDQWILCQIDYNFTNDTLNSAKTIAYNNYDSEGNESLLLAMIDYQKNEFMGTSFDFTKNLNEVMNGDFEFSDVLDENFEFYRGNIVKNINSIDFDDLSEGDSATETIFNSYCDNFAFGIDYEKSINYENFVINDSFIDAMDYSTNKVEFIVRVNPDNKFEYQYISTWFEYEDAVKLLEDIIVMDNLNEKPSTKQLLIAYKNRLVERGKYSYIGNNDFEYDSGNFLSIAKSNDDIDTYMVSVVTEDEGVFECTYKYEDGELIEGASSVKASEFTAQKSQDGTYAIITNIKSYSLVVTVPAEIEVDGTKLPVKEFGGYCYHNGNAGVVMNLPASIEKIIPYCINSNVREINIDSENQYFSSQDGVLYNKDKTTIICYPEYKLGDEFSIPEGVVEMHEDAFVRNKVLKTLNIPASFTGQIKNNDFYSVNITAFNVANGSITYSSNDGILYSADGKTLIACPNGKSGVINVKNGTEILWDYSFDNCDEITQVNLPNTLTTIRASFGNCGKLTSIIIPDGVEDIQFGDRTACFSKMIFSDSHPLYTTDENNFVYSKDKTTLYFVPGDISGVVTIPSHVTTINTYVFSGRKKITEIIVPSSVVTLESRAFGYYSGAEKITFEGVIELNGFNDGPFSQAFDLEELTIKGLIGTFDWGILDDCENFHTINYGNTIEEFKSHLTMSSILDQVITVHCTDGDYTYSLNK
ncbi:MAG: hypothetical protein E7345_05150 [Clostridiales bacterium]|nr:hypothetical protein [Clostridiales bacterium]